MGLEHLRHVRRPGRVLEPHRSAGVFEHGREPVRGPLTAVASHWWWVRWTIPDGRSFHQRVLSDPVLHLTFEDATGPMHGQRMPAALVHGVVPEVFEVELPASGRVSGLAFQPGGLAALLGVDASALTGRVLPAAAVFGDRLQQLADNIVAEPDETVRRERVAAWLLVHLPARKPGDPAFELVRRACALVENGDYRHVDELAAATHVSPRTLQRSFVRLVGVPPLWVLRRRRLQRVAERLAGGEATDLARVAAELGYADQAHLSRDFRAIIGVSPSAYRAGSSSGASGSGGDRVRPDAPEEP